MSGPSEVTRRFVPPFGWPLQWQAVTVTPAQRQRRLLQANRYPGQIIGVAIRLPDEKPLDASRTHGIHRSLSILWAKPARWWKQ